MVEEWLEIPGLDRLYEASSLGRIRRAGKEHLTSFTSTAGYDRVPLSRGGRTKTCAVHRLVALAFLGEPPQDKPTVNHINGVKRDNIPANLEWASRSENYRHALDVLGFRPPRGVDHWNAKNTPEVVLDVRRRLAAGESHSTISRMTGVAKSSVSLIRNGKLWAHV